MFRRQMVVAGAFLLLTAGCGQDKLPGGVDPALVKANLLDTEPSGLSMEIGADFGGRVVYLGSESDTGTVIPGGEVSLTHYWKVVEPPGERWRIFSHAVGSQGEWLNVDHSPMRAGYPVARWKAGQVIRDEHRFQIGEDWKSDNVDVLVGFYKTGSNARMPLIAGAQEGRPDSVLARTFSVRVPVKAVAASHPPYTIWRAEEPLVIDGVADESSWAKAPSSPVFSGAAGGSPIGSKSTARLLWDDDYLYLFAEFEDADIFSSFKKDGGTLWKDDVLELFIDADRNQTGYVEVQVNPHNAHYDSWFPATRAHDGDSSWSSGVKSAVTVNGTLDKRDDQDDGWAVEAAIPVSAVRGTDLEMAVEIPPQVGDQWHLNVIRVDKEKGAVAASSWNPISIRDFHALDKMLTVVFGDAQGQVPGPQADAGASTHSKSARPGN